MVDQLNGTLFPDGPAEWLHAPNLNGAWRKSRQDSSNAYAPFPLCARRLGPDLWQVALPFRIGVFDNAAEFGSDTPDFWAPVQAGGLSALACRGKMHFLGADQLHGFEGKRLTTDVYPADYGWTPGLFGGRESGSTGGTTTWEASSRRVSAEVSHQLEYDDEVTHHADPARIHRIQAPAMMIGPWLMVVSFTHPHDPYVARRKYWNLQYESCEHLKPDVGHRWTYERYGSAFAGESSMPMIGATTS